MVDRNTTRKPHTFKAKTPSTLEPLKKKCVCDAILSLSTRGRFASAGLSKEMWMPIDGKSFLAACLSMVICWRSSMEKTSSRESVPATPSLVGMSNVAIKT